MHESEQLFATAAEHEGVATLQPDNAFSLLGKGNEQVVDGLLRQRVIVRSLPGLDDLDVGGKLVEQRPRTEPIDDHDIGLRQQPSSAHCD